jgi:hypothetical protein
MRIHACTHTTYTHTHTYIHTHTHQFNMSDLDERNQKGVAIPTIHAAYYSAVDNDLWTYWQPYRSMKIHGICECVRVCSYVYVHECGRLLRSHKDVCTNWKRSHTCTHMHINIYTVLISTHVHINTHTHTRLYINIHKHTHVCVFAYTQPGWVWICLKPHKSSESHLQRRFLRWISSGSGAATWRRCVLTCVCVCVFERMCVCMNP